MRWRVTFEGAPARREVQFRCAGAASPYVGVARIYRNHPEVWSGVDLGRGTPWCLEGDLAGYEGGAVVFVVRLDVASQCGDGG